MESEDRISTAEAELFAGVSKTTLLRFADAGYFAVEEDPAGRMYFSKSEICNLFNLNADDYIGLAKDEPNDAPKETSELHESEVKGVVIDPVGRTGADYATADGDIEKVLPDVTNSKITSEASETVQKTESDAIDQADETISENTAENIAPDTTFSLVQHEDAGNATDTKQIETLQLDKQKLERVIELQEQLLDSREAEIKDLKEQRVWLKERLERAEEKADRDQLLLISEMQMLSKLVNQQQKRSVLSSALTWLGFKVQSDEAHGKTIDYQMHKEKREAAKKEQAA